MKNNFQISSIPFQNYFDLEPEKLSQLGGVKMIADAKPGYPCRVSLTDADIGETLILIPFEHHPVNSPYRASGPIFIRKNAQQANLGINEIPKMLQHRFLSLRTYDKNAMMIDACTLTITGQQLQETIAQIFKNPESYYIHIHNASHGCFMCQVNKAQAKA